MGKAIKRSRKSFIVGYIFAIIFGIILFSVYTLGIFDGFFLYLLSFPLIYLMLLPEYNIISSRYFIKDENVEEVVGIITKRKSIIPWSLVSNVSMRKGILGTILDYGDVVVTSIGSERKGIVMRGLHDPEKVLRRIENRIGKGKVDF